MKHSPTLLLLLLFAACKQSGPYPATAGGDDGRVRFLRMTNGDPWAKWPDGVHENPADDGQPCERVPELSRQRAIALLAQEPAVALDARIYERLTGAPPTATKDTLYLLRGFATDNSEARVKVTGAAVTVHSDALGGLFNLRRQPCIAALSSAPAEVYTVATYDM